MKKYSIAVFFISQVFSAHEVVDGSVTLIKNAVCGAVIDPDRLLLGAEEGLFCVDIENCGECLTPSIGVIISILNL